MSSASMTVNDLPSVHDAILCSAACQRGPAAAEFVSPWPDWSAPEWDPFPRGSCEVVQREEEEDRERYVKAVCQKMP